MKDRNISLRYVYNANIFDCLYSITMLTFLVIIFIIYCIYLTSKVSKLEKKIDSIQSPGSLPTITSPAPLQQSAATATTTSQTQLNLSTARSLPNTPITTSEHDVFSDLLKWLSTDWLLKLGAFLLILGIGWFVSYAFAENWIGPVGRVTLGLVAGSAILFFGEWWNKRNPLQATIFMIVGVMAILLTTYAARTVYDFFTPVTALLLMAAAAGLMAISSVIHKIESRVIVSIALAAIVPFLTAAGTTSVIGFLAYGFVITVASIWIVSITGWRRVSAVALLVYFVYSLLSMFGYTSDDIFLLRVLIFSYTTLFYAVGLVTHLRVKVPSVADYTVTLGNAFIMTLWIQRMDATELASLLTTAAAFIFFIGAYFLFKAASKPLVILEYTAVALALLAIAATFELDGPVLSITYSVLACAAAFLTQAITGKIKYSLAAGMLLAPAFLHSFSYQSVSDNWGPDYRNVYYHVDYRYLVTWWAIALETLGLGYYFYQQGKKQQDEEIKLGAAVYLIGSLAVGLLSIWHTVGMVMKESTAAVAVSLVIYTVLGLFLYVYGKVNSKKKTMYSGAVVLSIVVFRLLFVEIWSMVLFQRVIVFSLIGVLLMSTAFIKAKNKES